MATLAKIKGFRVDSCGYYEYGETARPCFGGLGTILQQLGTWAIDNELPIRATKTYEADPGRDLMPVYLMGVHSSSGSGSGVMALWNQTDLDGDQFGALMGDSVVGAGHVEHSAVPAGGIPGYPTYYWVYPARMVVVSIRFDTALNGHRGLKHYLQAFLDGFSPHVCRTPGGDIRGYRSDWDVSHSPIRSLFARWKSSPTRSGTLLEEVRQRQATISKLLQKKQLTLSMAQDRRLFHGLLRAAGLLEPQRRSHELSFSYAVDFAPSEQELESILEDYEDGSRLAWEDLGFKFTGDPQEYWLGKREATHEVGLDVIFNDDQTVNLESLSNAVRASGRTILSRIEREIGSQE